MDSLATRCYPPRATSAVLALALCACATSPEPQVRGYEQWVDLAQVLVDADRPNAAIKAYREAAAADPARKEPWRHIASLSLEAGRPVPALAAAEEALQRDPTDAGANEVFIAAGLQVASQAMQRLAVAGKSPGIEASARARELAALMGQVFGAESLIPEHIKADFAKLAEKQCKPAEARPAPEKDTPEPPPDPLDVLGDG